MHLAAPDDAEAIIRVINSTYGYDVDQKPDQWAGWQRMVREKIGHYWILRRNREIIGICKCGRRWLAFGQARMASAEISEICILPPFQGHGCGTAMMDYVLQRMDECGIALSRLTARRERQMRFYERFGYSRLPTRRIELHVEEPAPPESGVAAKVRPFDPQRDLRACIRLCNDFNEKYVGSLVWNENSGGWTDPYRLVFSEDDSLLAYLYAHDCFGQLAYRRDRPDTLQTLLRCAHDLAQGQGAKRLTVKAPLDPEIIQILTKTGLSFSCEESYPLASINMLRIVNLRTMLDQLAPELEGRRRSSVLSMPQAQVAIDCGENSFGISVHGKRLRITRIPSRGASVTLSHRDLLNMILGQMSFGELPESAHCTAESRALLCALFPRRVATGGSEIWGPDNYDLTAEPLASRKGK